MGGGKSSERLLLAKLAMLLGTFSIVGWAKFSGIYSMSELGLTTTQVGLAKSVSLLFKTALQPIWAAFGDIHSKTRILALATILSTLTLNAIQFMDKETPFWMFFIARTLRSMISGAFTIQTALILHLVSESNQGFGKQRIWGSVAWGTGSFLVGLLVDYFGIGVVFVYSDFMALIMLGLYYRIDMLLPPNEVVVKRKHGLEYLSRVWANLKSSPQILLTFIHAFGIGFCMSVVNWLVYLVLENDLGASRKVNGLATLISVLGAFPTFWYSKKLIQRYGYWRLMLGAEALLGFRLILLSASTTISQVLLLQVLHGFTFASNFVAIVELINDLTEDDVSGMMQTLIVVAYHTLSPCIAHPFWGYYYETHGASSTYFAAAFLSWVLMLSMYQLLPRGSFSIGVSGETSYKTVSIKVDTQ